MAKIKPIPDGYHSVTPYLIVRGGADAIEFYQRAFGAVELMRLAAPDGKIAHAEVKIGNSPVMLADETAEMESGEQRSPHSLGGASAGLMVYVENVDALHAKAVAAGARVLKPLQDQFYGDRSSTLVDPFGHVWTIATHIEDVSPEEIDRRTQAMFGGGGKPA